MRLMLLLVVGMVCTLFSCGWFDSADLEPGYELKIAYNVLVDGKSNYDVFLMNLDGSGKENLTEDAIGVDWAYHGVEGKIYFVSDRDTASGNYFLYEVDIDTEYCRKVFRNRLFDSWLSSRKKGTELIVCTAIDDLRAFVIIDSSGKEIREVLRADLSYEISDPCFSPDGHWIVYRSDQTGNDELWIVDELGLAPKQLTKYPPGDTVGGQLFYHAGPPKWLPANRLISYISHQGGKYSIFAIDRFGNEIQKINADSIHQGWHDWSPDGQWIAYSGSRAGQTNYDIYLMQADGSNSTLISDEIYDEQAPLFVKSFK